MATTAVDTSAPRLLEVSAVDDENAATVPVDAAIQPRVMDASAATTAPRLMAATKVDTSTPPLLEVPTFAAADAATALVDAAVQPREMEVSTAKTEP